MKNKLLLIIICSFYASLMIAQTYQVGKTTITFQYPARNNRNIETVIFYPAQTAGTNVPVANGTFPAIVFGHGFIMADEALYQYLWDNLVPEGYICLFPKTEGGAPPFNTPKHEEFGKDLRFLNTKIKSENTNQSSVFYGKVSNKTMIMGHSMGGKATYIAAADNNDVTAIISLAAAMSNPPWPYTNSHGYDALGLSVPNTHVPTLVIDAEFDCVVPENEGHIVIYNTLPSTTCKTYVNILGGGHCYFASQAGSGMFACESGEGSCSGDFSISREEQNQTVLNIIKPFIKYYLNDDYSAMNTFINYITTSSAVTYQRSCQLPNPQISQIDYYNQVQNINVPYGTPLNTAIAMLPQSITISDTHNQLHQVNLSWTVPGYNAYVSTNYNAYGTFSLPVGVDQTNPPTSLTVNAIITVDQSTLINLNTTDKINMHPNPTDGIVYYVADFANYNNTIQVLNIQGKVLMSFAATEKGQFDISHLSKGIYFVKFGDKTIKLFKE
ncbi:MAG TPA: T9SS type A sorting domain-containing protein [Bacteroidales bacterium]|nr:T9SS type A sorting domain-containing protein [Bacteroidales bacterium]HOL97881.1 T9SS type A sorting domain-containing protein [Bacteroidales bacterium]HOM35626.1 T9SS type A sorting domain-containing protein [Bacteroidales bacterium]HPD22813.1 T9SS type A sorting domain-containing protein [Bacteroidales bacterium]HRS98924.1 T9SS type A sorting domain-containing protein [Bacteroidales bacterium]